jgi:predicted DNA-binding ribbon-helix-helix protein
MKSTVIKRSVMVGGHKTSVSLENAFWEMLKNIAKQRHMTLSDLVGKIDSERDEGNLSSAIRLFVLKFCSEQIAEQAAQERTREILGAATVRLAQK